nr:hypothetical protein [Candidatus Sigynarchaeota archaeon]
MNARNLITRKVCGDPRPKLDLINKIDNWLLKIVNLFACAVVGSLAIMFLWPLIAGPVMGMVLVILWIVIVSMFVLILVLDAVVTMVGDSLERDLDSDHAE